jgi:amino acid adenylation domain-containing protein
MSFIDTIEEIRSKGISIRIENNELDVSAPKGVMTQDLLLKIKEYKADFLEFLAAKIPKTDVKNNFRLSPSQKRFWILSKFEGGNEAYNIQYSINISEVIQVDLLERALEFLIERHPTLRTEFRENESGDVEQCILSKIEEFKVDVKDHTSDYKISEFEHEMAAKNFNLSIFPLFHIAILNKSNEENVLFISMHHIISDEWSAQLFFDELLSIYGQLINGGEISSNASGLQFVDYSEWLNDQLENGKLDDSEKYWTNHFNAEIPGLNLPGTHSRPLVKTFNGSSTKHKFRSEVYDKLIDYTNKQETTLFTTLLTATNAILYRYSAQKDIVIGIPVSGREKLETKDIIGLFINSLPIYTEFSETDTFNSLIGKEKQLVQDALKHQLYPFDLLVEKINVQRDPSRSPLFDIMMTIGSSDGSDEDLEETPNDIEFREQKMSISQFDIVFRFIEKSDSLEVRLEYNSDIFDEIVIQNLFQHLENFIEKAIDSPDLLINKINYLSEKEEQLILETFNQTEVLHENEKTIVDLIELQATEIPDQVAVVFNNRNYEDSSASVKEIITYSELSNLSNQFANYLIANDVKKGDYVSVLLDKSEWLIVALLGILKVGGVYVPIDPEYPEDRKLYFKTLTDCKFAIDDAQLELFHEQLTELSTEQPIIDLNPDDLVHVMFTSGSTGLPKGVMLSHRNIVGLITPCSYMELNRGTKLLSTVSVSFDTTNMEFWGVLANGARVILESKESLLNLEIFKESIVENEIDTMFLTSSWFENIVDNDITIFENVKQFLTGGDVVSYKHVNLIRNRYPDLKIIICYGPTEDTTFSTVYNVEEEHFKPIPIGKPIDNGSLYILNEECVPQPVGIAGMVYVGGVGVAQGYFKNEELTNAKFIRNPFNEGEKIYNTGDLARWMPDGNVDFIGRVQRQIKIRGKIIDTTEIENNLNQFDEIQQSIVVVHETKTDKKIVAYLVLNSEIKHDELKAELKLRIPLFMIPFAFIEIAEIPLTPNGKADRKALPKLDDLIISNEIVEPTTELELELVEIWKQVLKIENIGVTNDFFDLGGHSLLATRVVSLVKKELKRDLLISELFLNSTIYELANILKNKKHQTEYPLISTVPKPDNIPLSFAQERLWFIDQLQGSTNYHVPFVFRINGDLDILLLQEAFRQIIVRHEVFQTCFKTIDGNPYQYLIGADDWKLKTINSKNESDVHQLIQDEIALPFDLTSDYLERMTIIQLDPTKNVLVLVMHHIVSDGWSISILMDELVTFYNALKEGSEAKVLPLTLQYSDFAIWQRKQINPEMQIRELNYWVDKLTGIEPLQLPLDFKRPIEQSTTGSTQSYDLSLALSNQISQFSDDNNVTLFMTTLAAFKVLLYRYSGQDDICVGTPIANRTRKEIEPLIGFFVNTLAIRTDLEGNPDFKTVLNQIKNTTLEAYDYQNTPFEKIIENLDIQRELNQSPVFQVMFTLHNNEEIQKIDLVDLNIEYEPFEINFSKFDISINITKTNGVIAVDFVYSTDLFTKETIDQFFRHYKNLLEDVVTSDNKEIDSMQLISKEDIKQIEEHTNTSVSIDEEQIFLIDAFETQALKTPKNTALICNEIQLSYDELNRRSNQIAHRLQKSGAGKGTIVGIQIEDPLNATVSILGVMKSGAIYLPIDPETPENRIDFIIVDSKLTHVICDEKSNLLFEDKKEITSLSVSSDLWNDADQGNVNIERSADDLVYIIYTSGSTGNPKGVGVNNENLADYFQGLFHASQIGTATSFGLFTTLAADLGNTILFSSLILGSELHLFEKTKLMDAHWMHNYLSENRIDCIKMVPSHWRGLSFEKELLPQKMIFFGGEELSIDITERIKDCNPSMLVYNHYGPTETTIGKLLFEVDLSDELQKTPIGKSFTNNSVFVLDKNGGHVPNKVVGEICISGKGVSPGYINQADSNAEKFVLFPELSDERFYKTGDLAYRKPDGNIVFLGRKDDQIKIRGHRVEIGEIQHAILENETISESYVSFQLNDEKQQVLIAYLVVKEGFDLMQFRLYLKSILPDAFIPSHLVQIDELPLNSNGKVNRFKLPKVAETIDQNVAETANNETEEKVLEIWKSILSGDNFGITDSFFDVGGHSLLVTRMISEIRSQFNKEISIKTVFMSPTIREISELLRDMTSKSLPTITKSSSSKIGKLSFAQERMWFLDQLQGSTNYHIPIVFKWKDSLNCDNLEKAFQQLIDRHQSLRSIFTEKEGTPTQELLSAEKWKLNVVKPEGENLDDLIQGLISEPFDLSADFPVRANVIQLQSNENILVIVKHHIVTDGWSRAIFMDELVQLFIAQEKNEQAQLKELSIQYHDYIAWQSEYLNGDSFNVGLDYWIRKLEDIEVLNLPYDFVRPSIQSSKGRTCHYLIEKDKSNEIGKYTLDNNVSLYMFMLSVFKVLLHRYSGQNDICIGTPIANRTQSETESLIGLFVNTLVVRSHVDGKMAFDTLLQQVKETCLDAFEHQNVPFEKVVNNVFKQVDTSRNPIFDVMFSLNNYRVHEDYNEEFSMVEFFDVEHVTAQVDINFNVNETKEGIWLDVEYCTDLFEHETISRLLSHYTELITSFVSNPKQSISEGNILPEKERDLILGKVATENRSYFNSGLIEFENNNSINSRFEDVVSKFESQPAIVHNEINWSYSELNRYSNQVGHLLQALGVSPGTCVGVYMERCPEFIGTLMGILKAGGIYVPLDTQNPSYRLEKMIKNQDIKVIITNSEFCKDIDAMSASQVIVIDQTEEVKANIKLNIQYYNQQDLLSQDTFNLPNINEVSSWAYMMFTSGSTGEPKAAITRHDGAINHILAEFDYMELSDDFRLLQSANIGSDISVWQMLGPLLKGGAVVIIDKMDLLDYQKSLDIIEGQKANLVEFVPSYLWGLIDYLNKSDVVPNFKHLEHLMLTGEDAPISLVNILRTILPKHVRIYNCYGPCEASDDVVQYEIKGTLNSNTPRLPIGTPIANMNVVVLDHHLKLCPIGVPGEIYISGIGVGAGYYGDEKKTSESFIPNQYEELLGEVLYKTGDLGKWLSDGNLDFLGRKDSQVKIRGNRIELGEIASLIRKVDRINECHIIIHRQEGKELIVCFVVSNDKSEEFLNTIKRECKSSLPAHMVPNYLLHIEALPTNLSDKTDEKKLIKYLNENFKPEEKHIEEELNEIEQFLVELWKEELQLKHVSKYDDFFQIGGHSLLATKIMFGIREQLDVKLPIITLFNYNTISELGDYINFLKDQDNSKQPVTDDANIIEI